MEKTYQHKIITIPNMLSLFRLLLIPVILWLYIVRQDHTVPCFDLFLFTVLL